MVAPKATTFCKTKPIKEPSRINSTSRLIQPIWQPRRRRHGTFGLREGAGLGAGVEGSANGLRSGGRGGSSSSITCPACTTERGGRGARLANGTVGDSGDGGL